MSSEKKQHPFPLRVRIIQLIFLTAAVLTTLGLAYWQLGRFNSVTGTGQNLGYALQWPAFGVFFIAAYRKYIAYEKELQAGNSTPSVDQENSLSEIPEDFYSRPDTISQPEDNRRQMSRKLSSPDKDN